MYCKALLLALVGAAFFVAATAQTTASAQIQCGRFNATNCTHCISEGGSSNTTTVELKCYWCGSTKRCNAFSFNTAIPIRGIDCPNIRYNVGTCAIEVLFIVVIIAVACLLFVLVLCCCCCVCCCMCASRNRRKKIVEENKYLDEKDSIRQRSAERRADRKAKHDDIRRKYGLNAGGEDGNYKRLDN